MTTQQCSYHNKQHRQEDWRQEEGHRSFIEEDIQGNFACNSKNRANMHSMFSLRWAYASKLDKTFFQRGLARVNGAYLVLRHPGCQSLLVGRIIEAQSHLTERTVAILGTWIPCQCNKKRSLSVDQF